MGTWQGCESTLRGQKNTSDPLTLEIQAVVRLPNWALGKGLRSSRWVASAGKCWGISPAHSWVSCHSGCCDTHTWGCSSFWLVFLALTPRGYGTVIALPYGFFFFICGWCFVSWKDIILSDMYFCMGVCTQSYQEAGAASSFFTVQ